MPALNGYGQALQQAQANYANVLGAFGAGQNALNSQLPGIYSRYGALTNKVGDLLGQSYNLGAGDIQRQAAQNSARVTQGLANRGLSNSTIWGNLQNQQSQQTQREYAGLALGVANQALDRQTQVGLAGLAARMQGAGMQSSLYGQQGGTLAGFRFPDGGGYGGGGGGGSGGGGYGGSGRVSGGGYSQTNWGTDPNSNVGRNAFSSVSPYQANSYGGQGMNVPSYGGGWSADPEMSDSDPYNPYGSNYGGAASWGLDPYGGEWEAY